MQQLLPAFDSAWAFVLLVLGFGFVIFVHELGHFAVAKWVGIKVTQFAIGFGQSLLTWRQGVGFRVGTTEPEYDQKINTWITDRQQQFEEEDQRTEPAHRATLAQRKEQARLALNLGETEYRLNWMPLGGYVKMLGQEDMNPDAAVEDPRSFSAKPIWARAAVICAGVVMNLIFAVLFFIVAFMMGVKFPPAIVGDVEPGSPASEVFAVGHDGDDNYKGLKPGDRVVSVDGQHATDFSKVQIASALAAPGTKLDLVIDRPLSDGTAQQLTFQIEPRAGRGESRLLMIGIEPPVSLELAEDRSLPEPLNSAGVTGGMVIQWVAGEPVKRFDQFLNRIAQAKGLPVPVTFKHPTTGKEATVELRSGPRMEIGESNTPHLHGLVPATRINRVMEDSTASKAGIQSGDLVMQLNDIPWPTMTEIGLAVRESRGEPLYITLLRGNAPVDLDAIRPRGKMLGIEMGAEPAIISRTLPGSPFESLWLPAGSRLLSINGNPVQTFGDIQRLLAEAMAGKQEQWVSVNVGYELFIKDLPQGTQEVWFSPETAQAAANPRWVPPSVIFSAPFKMLMEPVNARTPLAAAALGLEKTQLFMIQTYLTIARAFQGTVPVKEFRGPVGIVHIGTRITQQGGVPYLLFFLGLISVNLVVINFLPIPITDGGLMLFLLIEKIKGSPISARVQTAALLFGVALIGSLFIITLYHDAIRLWTGG